MKYWYELNIPVKNAIKSDWKWPNPTKTKVFFYKANQIINSDWLSMMENIGIPFQYCVLLYKDHNVDMKYAHIESMIGDPEKIIRLSFNWTGNFCPDNKMRWYKLPSERKITHISSDISNQMNIPYSEWNVDTLELVDQTSISATNLTMLRIDVPHSMSTGRYPRWGVCLRTNAYFPNWDDAVSFVRSKNLI